MANKAVITTQKAPAAIGPYSQAIKVNNTVYLSGQIPLVPETMELVGSDIVDQATQVFKNLSAVCEAAGGTLKNIVEQIEATGFKAPAIAVIGNVVNLHQILGRGLTQNHYIY